MTLTLMSSSSHGAFSVLIEDNVLLTSQLFSYAAKAESHFGSAPATAKNIIKLLKKYKVKTITYDNGSEFAGHLKVNEKLATRSFFCKPYHSREKGGVENYNGLVRQYFPKGSNFKTISTERLRAIEKELNLRPRKGLNFQSPEELKPKFKKTA